MLRCILADGSYFCGDRDDLTSKCGLIADMLEDRDEVVVPLPMIPTRHRMRRVVRNTQNLPLPLLIDKANDADYLNCQVSLTSAIDALVNTVHCGKDEDVETIVNSLVPGVLRSVLSQVDAVIIINHYLKRVHTFPLLRHWYIVMEGCGVCKLTRLHERAEVCNILRFFPNVQIRRGWPCYMGSEPEYIKRVFDRDPTVPKTCRTARIAIHLRDMELLKQCIFADWYVLVKDAVECGNDEAAMYLLTHPDLRRKRCNFDQFMAAFDIACRRGYINVASTIADYWKANGVIQFGKCYSYSALKHLLTWGFVMKLSFEVGRFIAEAARDGDVEIFKFLLKRQVMTRHVLKECKRVCTDPEIMKELDAFSLSSCPEGDRLWRCTDYRSRTCLFGSTIGHVRDCVCRSSSCWSILDSPHIEM